MRISDWSSDVCSSDLDPPLRLVVLAELDAAIDLADDRVFLRPAGLKQLRDTRQTAGDVAGLRGLARDTRQHVAGRDLDPILDRQDGVDRHEVAQIGRETCRESVCQYVTISVVAVK